MFLRRTDETGRRRSSVLLTNCDSIAAETAAATMEEIRSGIKRGAEREPDERARLFDPDFAD